MLRVGGGSRGETGWGETRIILASEQSADTMQMGEQEGKCWWDSTSGQWV